MNTLLKRLLLTFASILAMSAYGHATTITYTTGFGSGAYAPLVQPDWSTTLFLPKFNPSLGTLTGVQITNRGEIAGSVAVENKNTTQTRTINADLAAALDVTLPGLLGTLSSTPISSHSITLPQFDGTIDFAGTSGLTINNLSAFNSAIYTSLPTDLALFIGIGNINYDVLASDNSSASGSGNTASNFSNAAGVLLDVQYTYTDAPVPEPGTIMLMGSGLLMFGGRAAARFRRKAKATSSIA